MPRTLQSGEEVAQTGNNKWLEARVAHVLATDGELRMPVGAGFEEALAKLLHIDPALAPRAHGVLVSMRLRNLVHPMLDPSNEGCGADYGTPLTEHLVYKAA